jgi:hypothetical protein
MSEDLLRLNKTLQKRPALIVAFTVEARLDSNVPKIGGGTRTKAIMHLCSMTLGQDFGDAVGSVDTKPSDRPFLGFVRHEVANTFAEIHKHLLKTSTRRDRTIVLLSV